MKYNKKVQSLWNKANRAASDCPVEDELQDCPPFSFDLEEGSPKDGLDLVDFVLKNPDFAAVQDEPGSAMFIHLWKTEAEAIKKLETLLAKAEKTPKYS